MPQYRAYKDPLWPEPEESKVWGKGRPLAPLPMPPLPPAPKPNELEPWIVDPNTPITTPPKADPGTGQPIGPAFAKMPRGSQRQVVDSAYKDLIGNARAIKGSVFDTAFDKAARFGASDSMGGLGPQPMGGVVINPGHKLFQQLFRRSPKFAGGLEKVPEPTEYLSKTIREMPDAWGVTSNLPTQAHRDLALAGGVKGKRGITQEEVKNLAGRGHGATLQSFPGGKVADETLFHEGLHALYSKKFPTTQGPELAPQRAQELLVRVMRRMGATDDQIMRQLDQYGADPNHGLVSALAMYNTKKTGGMGVFR